MQIKYKKHLLITGIVLFFLLQNINAQAIKSGTENTGNIKEKTNPLSEIVWGSTIDYVLKSVNVPLLICR